MLPLLGSGCVASGKCAYSRHLEAIIPQQRVTQEAAVPSTLVTADRDRRPAQGSFGIAPDVELP